MRLMDHETAAHYNLASAEEFDALIAAATGNASPLPEYEHAVIGGVYLKQMACADAGTVIAQHAHNYTHATLVAHGAAAVKIDGVVRLYKAPAMIKVPAGAVHHIVAIADQTILYCIHKIRDEECVDDFVKEVA